MEQEYKMLLAQFQNDTIGDPGQLQPLVLAYIGDAVHNLFIRHYLVSTSHAQVNQLHKSSVSYVAAHSQSEVIHGIFPQLTEKEQSIVKRGRNAKSASVPKNADVTEYKYATGFEALVGYLFLNKELDRLMEILELSVTLLSKEKEENSQEELP